MFLDYCKVELFAGNGGNGGIYFNKDRYVTKCGPCGGNGGNGGNIIFMADSNVNSLDSISKFKKIIARNGDNGGNKNRNGKNAEDIIIKVPIGTMVIDAENNELLVDLNELNQKKIIVNGGIGGKGNASFKNSINKAPKIAENGSPGEHKKIILELKLIADIGLIGMPNAGKSTLLSVISNAKPKISNYPFTTIIPNLGVVNYLNKYFTVADLPGLIKNACLGKGLGLKFLRHIERCRIIIHVISMEENNPTNNFKVIENEIKTYNSNLLKKITIIVASKMDLENAINKKIEFEKKIKKKVIGISSHKKTGINDLLKICYKKLNKCLISNKKNNNSEKIKIYNAKNDSNLIKKIDFGINLIKNKEWMITDKKILRFYSKICKNSDKSLEILLEYLKKINIDKKLEEKGVKNGDTIYLENFSFKYVK